MPPSVSTIADAFHALVFSAMSTAVNLSLGLRAVADHPAFAVGASGGHGVDGTFEAVERHRPVSLGDTDRLVIVVAAHITLSHGTFLSEAQRFSQNGQ